MSLQIAKELASRLKLELIDEKDRQYRSQQNLQNGKRVALEQKTQELYGSQLGMKIYRPPVAAKVRAVNQSTVTLSCRPDSDAEAKLAIPVLCCHAAEEHNGGGCPSTEEAEAARCVGLCCSRPTASNRDTEAGNGAYYVAHHCTLIVVSLQPLACVANPCAAEIYTCRKPCPSVCFAITELENWAVEC